MKNQRREFINKALAGTAAISLIVILAGSILQSCGPKTETKQKTMKKLIINEIQHEGLLNIDLAEQMLESNADFQSIETINWPEYPYKPEVRFKIAYCQDQILLKYYVSEENIMAKETEINGAVYKDSCVEFFISINDNKTYYNFEFSCIGTVHAAHGPDRAKRELIDPEILKLIEIRSSLGNQAFEERTGGHQWEMMIIIPKECMAFDKDIILKGLKASANFYKCGDETSEPHYVSWSPIGSENPDYHQSVYFGELSFE